jgi:ethanolamine utilization protein EutN
MVLIVQGSSARLMPATEKLPIDTAIIGIVDTVQVGDKTVFDARLESA